MGPGTAAEVAAPDNPVREQPSRATAAVLARKGPSVADSDLVEIKEAFSAVAIAHELRRRAKVPGRPGWGASMAKVAHWSFVHPGELERRAATSPTDLSNEMRGRHGLSVFA